MAKTDDLLSVTNAGLAFGHVKALTPLGPRIAGTAREAKAAQYVADQFTSLGLEVEKQAVPGIMAWEGGDARLRPRRSDSLPGAGVEGDAPGGNRGRAGVRRPRHAVGL